MSIRFETTLALYSPVHGEEDVLIVLPHSVLREFQFQAGQRVAVTLELLEE